MLLDVAAPFTKFLPFVYKKFGVVHCHQYQLFVDNKPAPLNKVRFRDHCFALTLPQSLIDLDLPLNSTITLFTDSSYLPAQDVENVVCHDLPICMT